MNKCSILFLGTLAGIMVACDDAPATALPQENPQEPVADEITGATASPTSTMTAGIDLQSLLDAGTETLNLYTLNSGDSGLEPSSLSGEIEISNSESFAQYVLLEPVDGVQGTVNVADLNEAYLELFGKAPKTNEVYYRVPMYATVGGTTYRIGSTSSYGGTGTFNMTAPDPGFEILEHYYLISDLNGWTPTQESLADYEFAHSQSSPYDDPNFTIDFTCEGDVYWKVVPGDLYDEMGAAGFDTDSFWGLLIGVATDGDDSTNGSLIDTNANAAKIPAGEWTLTINMKDWTYSVTGTPAGAGWAPAGIYLRGGMNDWGTSGLYEFIYTEDIENGKYLAPSISIDNGTEFKIADANWGPIDLGGSEDAFSIGTAYTLGSNGNMTMPANFNGWVELTNNGDTYSTTFTQFNAGTAGTGSGIYLKGSLNDWSDNPDYEFVSTSYENVWEIASLTIPAGTEFKIADSSWNPINMGATSGVTCKADSPYALLNDSNSGNISFSNDFAGSAKLVYNKVYDKYVLYLISK